MSCSSGRSPCAAWSGKLKTPVRNDGRSWIRSMPCWRTWQAASTPGFKRSNYWSRNTGCLWKADPVRDYHINIFWSDEDGCYVADIPDLRFCSAFGEIPEDTLREVLVAKRDWLESAREHGDPIPE